MKSMKEWQKIILAVLVLILLMLYINYAITNPIKSVAAEIDKLNSNFKNLIQVENGNNTIDASSINLGQSFSGLERCLDSLNTKLENTNAEFNKLNREIEDSTLLGF